jgi:hypothetical protein
MLRTNPSLTFNQLQHELSTHLQRSLTTDERHLVSKVLLSFQIQTATDSLKDERRSSAVALQDQGNSRKKFIVASAYTHNYYEGVVCGAINRRWCERQGYEYVEDVLSLDDMRTLIAPRAVSWYKVLMLKRIMGDLARLIHEGVQYVVWVDADAFILDVEARLESIVELAENRELIMAEDRTFPVNAGIFLLRVCDWSQQFLEELWVEKSYFMTSPFEQSAFAKLLRRREEGLDLVDPYFSFKGGPPVKHFAHATVLAPHLFNANVSDRDVESGSKESAATFFYHPYGKKRKLELMFAMMKKRGLETPWGTGAENFPSCTTQPALLAYFKACLKSSGEQI